MESKPPTNPALLAWRRFRRNKAAMSGLAVIVLSIALACLGYLLAPDKTPDCNNQIPQLKAWPPLSQARLLLLRLNREVPQSPWFALPFVGRETPYKWLPYTHCRFAGDSLHLGLVGGGQQSFHLAEVAFPLAENGIQPNGNESYTLQFVTNETRSCTRSELAGIVRSKHLITQRFWLGTDNYGRDIFSRLLLGVRVSLLVGLIAVLISLTLGIALGALAGYYGGRADSAIMLLVNTVWSIPTLLLVFAVVLALGKWVGTIFLAVGLTMWVDVARIVRGEVMAFKQREFVEAARGMGFSRGRILFRHILPNLLGPVLVVASANFASAILLEAGLGYLGFGVQPPTPSWGTMLNENYGYAIGGKPFMAFAPALAIMLLVLAFNLVGNGLRDALDVREAVG